MGFFDFMNDKVNETVENNLDYLKRKARSASDDGLRNWWQKNQYAEGDFAERAKDIIRAEMDRRGMYY